MSFSRECMAAMKVTGQDLSGPGAAGASGAQEVQKGGGGAAFAIRELHRHADPMARTRFWWTESVNRLLAHAAQCRVLRDKRSERTIAASPALLRGSSKEVPRRCSTGSSLRAGAPTGAVQCRPTARYDPASDTSSSDARP